MTLDDIVKIPMVERVARAIRNSECGTGSTEPWEQFADDAYAAIQAMREPTEEMKQLHGAVYWPELIDAALGITQQP